MGEYNLAIEHKICIHYTSIFQISVINCAGQMTTEKLVNAVNYSQIS